MRGLLYHIPRTGGTSLCQAMHGRWLSQADIGPRYDDGVDREIRDAFDEAEVVGGHFAYGHHALLDFPVVTMTILRDPVERVRSLYWMAHEFGEGRCPEPMLCAFEGIEVFVRSLDWVQDAGARLLSGRPFKSGEPVTTAVARTALANLYGIGVLGVTEDLEGMADRVREAGVACGPVEHMHRPHVEPPGLSDSEVQTILTFNQADARLYEVAKGLI